jgi:hypothetical protein
MGLRKAIVIVAGILAVGTLLGGRARAATPPAGAPSASGDLEITGEHRGYTNDQLFLRISDEKEMTFVVRIPGDQEEKWHTDFKTLSRITVTYHQKPGDKLPVATAIRPAK